MSQANDSDRLIVPVSQRDRLWGNLDAPVVVVKYGNYQCPYSGEAHQTIKQIQQQLGRSLCFVFRHFPQSQIHPQSQKAAEAAEAAAAQGRFWQMHNLLFDRQQALGNGYLVEYASLLGLDISRFLRELSAHEHTAKVEDDRMSGVLCNVTQTPTFFVNGIRYRDDWNTERFLQFLLRNIN